MSALYDDPKSDHYQNPDDFKSLISLAPELPSLNESLPFDNRPYIIPLYKPAGISSFDVIRKVRSTLIRHLGKGKGRRKLKIGHFGTLDPFAEGLLLVGTGKAMKLMTLIQEELPKHYEAVGSIGIKTFTGDCDGEVMEEINLSQQDLSTLYPTISSQADMLKGEYLQAPPYFSAVKHEGKPLYEYAREGIFIEKPPVSRHIYELDILGIDNTEVTFRSKVSNGTYIRTLWQDMLSCIEGHGHLTKLIRDQVGQLTLADSITPDEFIDNAGLFAFAPDQVVTLPRIELSEREALDLLQGRAVTPQESTPATKLGWAFYRNYLIALVSCCHKNSEIKVRTLLWAARRA